MSITVKQAIDQFLPGFSFLFSHSMNILLLKIAGSNCIIRKEVSYEGENYDDYRGYYYVNLGEEE